MTSENIKPNFFVVGYPSCGTSALWNMFKQHPEFFTTRIKEINHFCTDLYELAVPRVRNQIFPYQTRESYMALFEGSEEYKIRPDFSVIYINSKDAAQNIYDFNPDAKILIIKRDRESLMRSLHVKRYACCDEPYKDFEKALAAEPERIRTHYIPNSGFYLNGLYKERTKFDEQIGRFKSIFPENNLKIIHQEELRNDTIGTTRMLFDWLNVDSTVPLELSVVNQAIIPRFDFLHRMLQKLHVTKWAQHLLSSKMYYKCYHIYWRWFLTKKK